MVRKRTYTDLELVKAVAASHSWRGVLRALGLASASSGAMRSVRSQADLLRLDYSHFTGQRGWTESALATAIEDSSSWPEVTSNLGLGPEKISRLKAHALRLAFETSHLEPSVPTPQPPPTPILANLDKAGPMLAAAWFMMCGHEVSWPLEPARYDLLVGMCANSSRVQVKTTRVRVGDGWKAYLSTSSGRRRVYGPEEIDYFFVIDGEFNYYLIPLAAAAGLQAIHTAAYARFQVRRDPP